MIDMLDIERFAWLRPMPTSVMVAAFAAVVILSVYLYRRGSGLPIWVRVALAVCRIVVLGLVVAALFEPTVTVKETRTQSRHLQVLIDVSESMSVKDPRVGAEDVVEAAAALDMVPVSEAKDAARAFMALDPQKRRAISGASRLDLAKSLISRSARPVFESLGEELDVSYHTFGKSLHMLGADEKTTATSIQALEASESGTLIAEALESAAKVNRGTPSAGIVLLSDGLDTSSRQTEAVISDLGRRGIPVYTVPIGVVSPDDVSISNVIMQEVAFSGDTVPVRVQIQSKGYEKRSTDLTVRLNGRSVAQRSVSLKGGLQFEDIYFNVDTTEKGAAQVEISVAPFADEVTPQNNRIERSVRVVNEKINVLCMEGSPRWEYRYLMAMLKRDPRINVTFIATKAQAEMAQNSSEYISRFPETREEAYKYDLVILGDVDSSFFSAEAFLRLEELVKDRGGSLVMLAGSRFAPTSYAGTPVERMLPVEFDSSGAWQDVDDNVYPVLTAEGKSSLVMTLETDPEKNDLTWSRVAPLNHIPPLTAARPGATVLVELSDARSRVDRFPLVSWQRYGTGKCMFIGTDRLWLLRFKTGDKYHWRVWSQCIQFLTLSRLMGEHMRIRLETDRATYPIGGQVLLYAQVLDDRFEPVTQAGFEVTVTPVDNAGGSAQRVTLRPDAGTPGMYEGYFSPPLPGRYRMEANASDRSLSNSTEFQVADIKPEMAIADMQLERLQRIADLSGGKCLSMLQLHELPSLINRAPESTVVLTEVPLLNNKWVIILLVALTGMEWIVRRRYDLP